jgi:hypothetical protein
MMSPWHFLGVVRASCGRFLVALTMTFSLLGKTQLRRPACMTGGSYSAGSGLPEGESGSATEELCDFLDAVCGRCACRCWWCWVPRDSAGAGRRRAASCARLHPWPPRGEGRAESPRAAARARPDRAGAAKRSSTDVTGGCRAPGAEPFPVRSPPLSRSLSFAVVVAGTTTPESSAISHGGASESWPRLAH